jgi:hypothetical protein
MKLKSPIPARQRARANAYCGVNVSTPFPSCPQLAVNVPSGFTRCAALVVALGALSLPAVADEVDLEFFEDGKADKRGVS